MRGFIAAFVVLLGWVAFAQTPYQPRYAGDKAKSEQEFAALGYMRTVVAAERVYFRKHSRYAISLAALVGTHSFTRRMVKTDRGDYRVSFRGKNDGYSLALTPLQFAPDRRAFFVDETGKFRVEEEKPATASSPKLE